MYYPGRRSVETDKPLPMDKREVTSERATYGIYPLQESIPKDIKRHRPPRLNSPITHPIPRIRKRQILLLNRKLLTANIKRHSRQLVRRGIRRKDITLLVVVVRSAGNGIVDGLARRIVDKCECGSGISNGGVAGSIDVLAVDGGRGAGEHPEPLGIVDGGVVRCLTTESLLVDVAKGVEGSALIGVLGVVDRTEVGGEELLVFRNVLLGDHVFDWSGYGFGGYGVDVAKGKA